MPERNSSSPLKAHIKPSVQTFSLLPINFVFFLSPRSQDFQFQSKNFSYFWCFCSACQSERERAAWTTTVDFSPDGIWSARTVAASLQLQASLVETKQVFGLHNWEVLWFVFTFASFFRRKNKNELRNERILFEVKLSWRCFWRRRIHVRCTYEVNPWFVHVFKSFEGQWVIKPVVFQSQFLILLRR